MFDIDIIDYARTFHSLREEWNDIANASPHRTPFDYHQWIDYSYKASFLNSRPLILRIRQNSKTVGFIPFSLYRSVHKKLNLRFVGFQENPDIFTNKIICTESPQSVLPAVLRFFSNSFRGWDLLVLNKLAENVSNALSELEVVQRQRRLSEHGTGIDLYIDTNRPWDDYYRSRSRNFRRRAKK